MWYIFNLGCQWSKCSHSKNGTSGIHHSKNIHHSQACVMGTGQVEQEKHEVSQDDKFGECYIWGFQIIFVYIKSLLYFCSNIL